MRKHFKSISDLNIVLLISFHPFNSWILWFRKKINEIKELAPKKALLGVCLWQIFSPPPTAFSTKLIQMIIFPCKLLHTHSHTTALLSDPLNHLPTDLLFLYPLSPYPPPPHKFFFTLTTMKNQGSTQILKQNLITLSSNTPHNVLPL